MRINFRNFGWAADEDVSDTNPLPVAVYSGSAGVVTTERKTVPGITTGAAYANLDAIGTSFWFEVPTSGIIESAAYYDLDDEGLQVDLWLFGLSIANQTDNNALVIPDDELVRVLDVLPFAGPFFDANTGQVCTLNGLGIAYSVPDGRVYAQLQARGALNIAAGNLPVFQLRILAD